MVDDFFLRLWISSKRFLVIIMVWQSHLSGEVRAIVPVTQNHFDFA